MRTDEGTSYARVSKGKNAFQVPDSMCYINPHACASPVPITFCVITDLCENHDAGPTNGAFHLKVNPILSLTRRQQNRQ